MQELTDEIYRRRHSSADLYRYRATRPDVTAADWNMALMAAFRRGAQCEVLNYIPPKVKGWEERPRYASYFKEG